MLYSLSRRKLLTREPRIRRAAKTAKFLLRLAIHGRLFFPKHSVRPVYTSDEITEVQELLYREYLKRNLCKEIFSKKLLNLHSLLPTSTTMISRKGKKLLGTIMIIEDGLLKLPSDCLYEEELDNMRSRGYKLVEVGSLALDNSLFKTGSHSMTSIKKLVSLGNLFTAMLNYVYQFTDATHLVIMVNPRHESLYKEIGFYRYSEIRHYSAVNNHLAVPMILDIEHFFSSAHKNVYSLYATKCMRVIQRIKKYKITAGDVAKLLAENPKFFIDLNNDEEETLLHYYPDIASILEMNKSIHSKKKEYEEFREAIVEDHSTDKQPPSGK
jgi:hypothetical protein